ncbi:MAG: hypothetical protein A2X94_06855 [Bdellovibrionales bacterium GWB1_55_8]|nr:MAG: hypothetical protein A2X94_06855 [Bdellovibrionales bacterium GWB1_55_8]
MFITLPFLFIGINSATADVLPIQANYVSTRAQEGIMSFDHFVEFNADARQSDTALQGWARQAIEKQLMFLIGSMRWHFSVPKGDHKITELRLAPKSAQGVTMIASYHYEGTVQIREDVPLPLRLVLPNNPYRFYWDGLVRDGFKISAPCTQKHYRWPSDLFYFWHPYAPACPWKRGEDYQEIQPEIVLKNNDETTYPEYDRLVDPATRTISMWILVGPASNKSMNPMTSPDINAQTFCEFREHFLRKGFSSRRWTSKEIRRKGNTLFAKLPWVEDFEKQGARSRILIHAFYGHTAVKDFSRAFYHFLEDGVENASMVVYAGHAGLGKTLAPSVAEKIGLLRMRPNRDRYQIYFFNGCSTYAYYTQPYFTRKASALDPEGTKNLDIITTGLATGEDFLGSSSLAAIDAVTDWADGGAAASYQEILKRAGGSNLLSVSGDEDNPSSPQKPFQTRD